MLLTHLRGLLGEITAGIADGRRSAACRRVGHAWTPMASPPACTLCGRTQQLQPAPVPALAPVDLAARAA